MELVKIKLILALINYAFEVYIMMNELKKLCLMFH